MTRHEYQDLRIASAPDGDDGPQYRLAGLPSGANFRDPDAYEQIDASMLKVEGVAFATSHAQFGEYRTTIVVTQKNPGGLVDISFQPQDSQ